MSLRRMGIAGVALAVALALVSCSGTSAQPAADDAAASGDAYNAASVKARAAVDKVAPDAVLVSAGSKGASTDAVPGAWAFVYLSPSTKHAWNVAVDGGKVGAPSDVGESSAAIDLKSAITEDQVKVSAVEAIDRARSRAKAQGDVPPSVVVGGTFVNVEGSEAMGMSPGVWTVVFTGGTGSTAEKRYQVNMEDGSVGAVK